MIFFYFWRYAMKQNGLELFTKIINVKNVNVVELKEDLSNLEMVDNRFRKRLYKDFSYNETFELFNHQMGENTLIRHTDNFLFNYFFLSIPDEYRSAGNLSLISIGPFTERRIKPEDVYHIMQKNQIPERQLHDISVFYDSTPTVENTLTYEQFVLYLASGLFDREYHLDHLPADCVLFYNGGNIFNTVKDNPQMAKDSITERYKIENEMMMAIAAGDYEQAHVLRGKFDTYHIRPRTENPLRNEQHLAIILNTLCRKAAETGGVHPLYIDDLSTRFAVLINKMSSIGEVNTLAGEMIHKYCILVKNYAMKGYSSVTKDIISYIDFHYSEDLNLSLFAEMFNISKNYLSNLFKKETGNTLTDFIHQTRMRKAITLINSSTLPVTAIATACGYNDINYFIRIFKRTYGLSPKQYQKMIVRTGR